MIHYSILKQIKMSFTAREHVRERIAKMLIRLFGLQLYVNLQQNQVFSNVTFVVKRFGVCY